MGHLLPPISFGSFADITVLFSKILSPPSKRNTKVAIDNTSSIHQRIKQHPYQSAVGSFAPHWSLHLAVGIGCGECGCAKKTCDVNTVPFLLESVDHSNAATTAITAIIPDNQPLPLHRSAITIASIRRNHHRIDPPQSPSHCLAIQ